MSDPTRTRIEPADPHATRTVEPSTLDADLNAIATADTSSSATPPSRRLGERYTLGPELARGGMGVVYRATDTVFGREVALKVLQEKYGPGSTAARRFADEARITGRLQHPAVPPVHDLGALPDGRPFLAMKLIRGQTFDALLKERTTPAEDHGRSLAVFEQIAQAVGFAHSHGVIHRDLKPANVMVGAFGDVQVMDWGLARETRNADSRLLVERPVEPSASEADADNRQSAIDDPQFVKLTHTGSVLGTPAFMPPEQAGGRTDEVGPPSDVFGLGAILAVILTGRPPFASRSAESTRQMAAAGNVTECFARLDGCGAETEWVALCKRCLAPAPADRPADAGEVARAVGELRQAADERARQVEQERARAEVRASESRKRRRVQTALAAVVGLLVVGGGAVAWWQERQASDRRTADLRRQSEDDQRAADESARLERNADAVRGLLDRTRDALAAGDVAKAETLLAEADKRAAEGGADDQRERIAPYRAEAKLLQGLDAVEQARWVNISAGGKPSFDDEWTLRTLREFGVDPGSVDPVAAGRRISEAVVRDRIIFALDGLLWGSRSDWLVRVLQSADPDPYRDALRAALGGMDVGRMTSLAADPRASGQPVHFLVALSELPGFVQADGNGGQSTHRVIPLPRMRELLRAALTRHPREMRLLLRLGSLCEPGAKSPEDERLVWFQAAVVAAPGNVLAWNNLAVTLLDLKEYGRAEAAAREGLRLDPTRAFLHTNLAVILFRRGDLTGADEAFRQALRLDPKNVDALSNWSAVYQATGDHKKSAEVCRQAIEIETKFVAGHSNLGVSLLDLGDLKGAEAALRTALALDPTFPPARVGLGNVLLEKGDVKGAEAEYREALRLNPRLPDAHYNLGILLRQKGNLADAEASHREAIRLDPTHAPAYSGLGNVLRDQGDLPGAVAALKESARLKPTYPAAHDNLGIVLAMSGDLDGAIKSFEEAVRLSPTNRSTATNLAKARQMKVAKVVKQLKGWTVTPMWPVPSW